MLYGFQSVESVFLSELELSVHESGHKGIMNHVWISYIVGVLHSEAIEIGDRVKQASLLFTCRNCYFPSAVVVPNPPIAPPANSTDTGLASGTPPVPDSEFFPGLLPGNWHPATATLIFKLRLSLTTLILPRKTCEKQFLCTSASTSASSLVIYRTLLHLTCANSICVTDSKPAGTVFREHTRWSSSQLPSQRINRKLLVLAGAGGHAIRIRKVTLASCKSNLEMKTSTLML